MLQSSKDIGKYEEPLLKTLAVFFVNQGYSVTTHARLNVAWSRVISDIDVLATNGVETVIVEVKSDHDDFYHAFAQLKKLKGFADRFYIATNRPLNTLKDEKWLDKSIGLVHIGKEINIVKDAERIRTLPPEGALSQLRKKCLVRLASQVGISAYLPKAEIEKRLENNFNISELKSVVKEIVVCECECSTDCILEPRLIASCGKVSAKHSHLPVKS